MINDEIIESMNFVGKGLILGEVLNNLKSLEWIRSIHDFWYECTYSVYLENIKRSIRQGSNL